MPVTDDRFVIPHHPNIDWTKPMPADQANATAPTAQGEDPG